MLTRKNLLIATALPVVALLAGCEKDLDSPDRVVAPAGRTVTIAALKALWTGAPVHFSPADTASPLNIYGVVNSDENDGNFYKSIYVQDATGGLCIRLLSSGGLYIGDSVRIYLPGTVLSPYNNLMQLDSVNVDVNVIKQATLVPITPIVVDIADLTPNALDTLQSRLIRLNDVEFTVADAAGGTWADAANQQTGERYLENCDGDQVMMRTSGYANYAGNALPTGRGTLLCIPTIFGSTVQLAARTLGEVQLNGPRCPGQELPFFFKNFEDLSISSGGWTQQSVSGSIPWVASSFSGDNFGRCTNFVGGANQACETWYISPAVNITAATNPTLTFRTACNYSGAPLEVYVSTNYTGGLPSTATWTQLSVALSPGSWTWTPSGAIDLTPYNSANFRVAFKYTGTNGDGKNYELDDIKIIEQ